MKRYKLIVNAMFACWFAQSVAAEGWTEERTGMAFVQLTKGCFKMGLPPGAFSDATGRSRACA